jgi:hypothetical protein
MFPSNEAETIQLFRLLQNRFGWRIIKIQKNAFPDAIIENASGKRLNVEFEFEDRNFRKHRHPIDGRCDLIICWRAKWEVPPMPVWELQFCAKEEAFHIKCLLSDYIPKHSTSGLRLQIGFLERRIKVKDAELSRLNNVDRWFYKISGDVSCVIIACGIFLWGLFQLLDWLIRTF